MWRHVSGLGLFRKLFWKTNWRWRQYVPSKRRSVDTESSPAAQRHFSEYLNPRICNLLSYWRNFFLNNQKRTEINFVNMGRSRSCIQLEGSKSHSGLLVFNSGFYNTPISIWIDSFRRFYLQKSCLAGLFCFTHNTQRDYWRTWGFRKLWDVSGTFLAANTNSSYYFASKI